MRSYEKSQELNVTPMVAFDFATDQRLLPFWSPQVLKSEVIGGGRVQEGSRLNQTRKKGASELITECEVINHEPPRRHTLKATMRKGVEATFTLTFEPARGGGTAAKLHTSVKGRGLGRFFEKRVARELEKGDHEVLARLKRAVENPRGMFSK